MRQSRTDNTFGQFQPLIIGRHSHQPINSLSSSGDFDKLPIQQATCFAGTTREVSSRPPYPRFSQACDVRIVIQPAIGILKSEIYIFIADAEAVSWASLAQLLH